MTSRPGFLSARMTSSPPFRKELSL
ncbi:hypothetical protein LINPERHAP2_LOCUS33712 [Linum perenne]